MGKQWADERDDIQPLPVLEPFYILAALEVGDPDSGGWLINQSPTFHDLYRKYRREITEAGRSTTYPPLPRDGASVLIQYMVWYERESRRPDGGNNT